MRLTILAGIAGAMLAVSAPAQAAWHGYISHPMGFAFAAPGEMKVEKGNYTAPVAGEHASVIYRFAEDGIEYRFIVIDVGEKANESATLLGEAQFRFQDGKKVIMDAFGRVDRQYGRKVTADLPNNTGRTMAAFYFVNGRILSLQATVTPENGDYDTPEMARFIDSITFFSVRAPDDATELPLAPK